MKIIHKDGFSVEERIAYRVAIYQNLLESAQAIVSAMHKLSIHPAEPQNRVRHRFIPPYTRTDNSEHPDNRRTNRIL
jgi:guanine nucleotide-binding protein G(i) subunit alpha